jgi:tetratricopeptide (TPR) repeat protein
MIQTLIRIFLAISFCSISYYSKAEKVFDFNATCQKAYYEITSLRLNNGQQLINEARKANPDNLIPDYLESYIDFFILFFNEDPGEYEDRKPHFEERLTKLKEGPDTSPFYKYCQSVVALHKATVAIKFGERWSAGWDFRKAFGLIKDNRKAFPNFTPNDLIYGPLEVAAGTIPDGYKWLTNLFGMKGSIQDGMRLMRNFLNGSDPWCKLFFNEGAFYYCYLQFYVENKPDEVLQFISQRKLDVVNNHLFTYLAGNLGINNKKTEYGKNVILNRNMSAEYMATPAWDFELGYARLRHMELPEAIRHFERFISTFKGKFYVKDVYEKLSWCYYLQGNQQAADNARQMILKKGGTDTDADKKAYKEAKAGAWPNMLLLKARLLNDGGYNKEALVVLNGKTTESFTQPEEKLEFAYRVARIYDDIGHDKEAIQTYLSAMKLGQGRTEYYAARAALQIGYIYERQGNKAMAISFFQQCLDMEDHEYKDSLDQRAKAGIARCKGQ